ncbi:retropepsin-like aspartic protease [Alicyclobacillus sp. ALC3]|uniref:retropepsin-like aspartic protease n=1 Tax=Alicyclobacillus sp. ALC3 TaxID=2796143 RepID=UPI002378BC73|nr:retropepsin-like aspartic protease [Alicyclobacillus sp. ALC3]WDL95796.1 retroviral-like aspartic protease family protein [Alicyclobacillus sp. ALC3]
MYTRIAQIKGSVQYDSFQFPLIVNGVSVPDMVLDTGAFELTFNAKVAKQLNLPVLQPVQIGGVGGQATAYTSSCRLNLGGHIYRNVPCVVDPSLSENGLFGLRFFIDQSLALTLNPGRSLLTVFRNP